MGHSDLVVRNFRTGDLSNILKLYDYTLAKSVHFVRDEDFLKYFMRFPGVNEDGIFVAVTNNEITGFAIVSISSEDDVKIGNIIEFQAKDRSSMHALIQTASNYCVNRDVDGVIVVPPHSLPNNSVLKGWIEFETGAMIAKGVSLSSLFRALLREDELRKSFSGKIIVFHVGDELIEIKVASESIEISEPNNVVEKNVVSVTLSPQMLIKIVFCQVNPLSALMTDKIRVRGIRGIPLALKLLNMLKLTDSIYVSLADRI